ncbi:hypothetical protein B7P43_G01744 [Cryptotermes secundus]|uniref:Uncharacterized protein n=1 Tax=Cryptotermes secundus TaxID=105785 RepID=A0A2J7R3H0_9NEOP|nr:hypothetical protein B7P43_G01744 [Cryptotermes secundus]
MNCLLAHQKRSEEGGIGMLCRRGGGMQGDKRKFGLPDVIYVIGPPVTPFGNTTSALVDEYLYSSVWIAEVVV